MADETPILQPMELGSERSAGLDSGCAPVVENDEHRRLLWLMVEFFQTVGFTEMRARLPGFSPPVVLSGTIEDHRPDVTCRQNDADRTPLIAEVVTLDKLRDPGMEHRWSLLGSAARLYSAELHFVVRSWGPYGPLETPLRRRLALMELTPQHVWSV